LKIQPGETAVGPTDKIPVLLERAAFLRIFRNDLAALVNLGSYPRDSFALLRAQPSPAEQKGCGRN
jgi:hypothetical protein